MKSSFLPLFCCLGLAIAACSAAPAETADTTTDSSALSTNWQNVLTCDDGGAVLDLDTAERRHTFRGCHNQ